MRSCGTTTPGRPTPGRRGETSARSSSPTGERLSHRSQIAARGSAYVVSLPRVPGAPRVRARPELPLRATIPEGNTVGQHADVDVGPSHRAPGLRAPGLIRAEMGTITP